MVLKSAISAAFEMQQELLSGPLTYTYREFIKEISQKESHVQVVSGIRRCGKSTLMKEIMRQTKGTPAWFNFEDARIFGFETNDFQKLDEVMGKNRSAYFFDEIQNVPAWELFVRQLHDRGEKVFITGSNASLLSRELGTKLTGRHLRHELFPFSYTEFLQHYKFKSSSLAHAAYCIKGGFPEYLETNNEEILQNLFRDIVLRDIAVRYGIKNTKTLMDLGLYLLSNVGKECTYNSLRKSFSIGSANSVSDYLGWLENAYLMFFLPRFSWSAKNISVNPRKVYAIDTGLVNTNTLGFSKERGRLLENAVYLHLRRQPYKLYYFRENSECDFVVFNKNTCKMLIQVCSEVHNENIDRELKGLYEAMDFFKKKEGIIITADQKDTIKKAGKTVELIPAWEWMNAKTP